MKIVHITESYIEGWGYQENLLPLYQKRAGHDVVVVSNNNHLVDIRNRPDLIKEIIERGNEYWHDGIKVYKIKTQFNFSSNTSLFCKGLYVILEKECPDMIFHHNVGIATLTVAAKYKKRHPSVKLYVDNHADWINESKNKIWHFLFYDIVVPLQIKRLGDTIDYYIGVSPLRCKYLNIVYRVPQHKIRFLPIGCDTEQANLVKKSYEELRMEYGMSSKAFVVVSGGKIDRTKGTLELIVACKELRNKGEKVQLVLFGKIDEEVGMVAEQYGWIKCVGWCNRTETLSLLKMADVACWPWLHTTLIEDSVAIGTPLVVKLSDNVSHFARENVGVFLKNGDSTELASSLIEVKNNTYKYRRNVWNARNKFSYSSLVQLLDNETFYNYYEFDYFQNKSK